MSCPICKKTTKAEYQPFCSKRCADVDLNRWLTGSYAIPVVEDDDERDSLPSRTVDGSPEGGKF